MKNLYLKEVPLERLSNSTADDTKRVHFANESLHIINELKSDVKTKDDMIESLRHELKIVQNQYDSVSKGVSL